MNVMGIIFANDATLGALTANRTMASLPLAAATVRWILPFPIWQAPVCAMWVSSPATIISL